ncbi:serine aminopeptidase domain-containing protein [Mucilaginibacter calamicampi]|uniref:Serine aminopeptidase domain-containing protein n=1 Tax=Mucilaginibacter calamicampi TaxID=1302352 RepID=A0ABW2YTF3_9SPHI
MFTSSFRFTARVFTLSFLAVPLSILLSSWAGFKPGNSFVAKTSVHSISFNNKQYIYNAATGYLPIKNGNKLAAKIFYSAYTLNSQANRPVTFVFNGGPGSASIWLHMGALAPVRVKSGNAAYSNNPQTWLGFTDLVFIDPVGTGYSRAAEGVNENQFFGFNEDVNAIANFVDQYLKGTNRGQSDIYLAGESYGGARAVGLAAELQNNYKIKVTGLTLISPALNYQSLSFKAGKDDAYPLYLPTYAMIAQYHNRLTPKLQALSPQALASKAKAFANGTYLDLLNGDTTALAHTLDTLSYFTGIDKTWLKQHNGRITDHEFARLVLNEGGSKTGIFDARVAGTDKKGDPSEAALRTIYPKALTRYFKTELKYVNELPYRATISVADWNFGSKKPDYYLNVVPTLKQLIQGNAALKVHVVGGYYDLATPVETIKQAVADAGGAQISSNYYYAGHMIYTDDKVNALFYADSKTFYANRKN